MAQKMYWWALVLCLAQLSAWAQNAAQPDNNRGAGVRVRTKDGQEADFYDNSHALIIGVSRYTNGWRDLPGVKDDVLAVAQALNAQGFQVSVAASPEIATELQKSKLPVTVTNDVTREGINTVLRGFMGRYGQAEAGRLLIYYAGHGHTLKAGTARQLGYIVPSDAPNPLDVGAGRFKEAAISLDDFQSLARQLEARHALFLFDSCFSGALVQRQRDGVPDDISLKMAQPVRQFITSGAADQSVPDNSIFRRRFVEGIQGAADLTKDHYITGSELYMYLDREVTNRSGRTQTPQYGKLLEEELDKGDFVFAIGTAPPALAPNPVVDANAGDAAFWRSVENSNDPQDLEGYLTAFPKGVYAALATHKLRRLQAAPGTPLDAETQLWKAVRDSRNAKTIYGYVRKYPRGRYADMARLQIDGLLPPRMVDSFGIRFVRSNPGSFIMGSSNAEQDEALRVAKQWNSSTVSDWFKDEGPQHTVNIGYYFYLGQDEVTQEQWQTVTGSNPSTFKDCPQCPVETISWDDAQEFIKKLNSLQTKYVYRLPTEAEWEYNARAGTTTAFAFGDFLSAHQANFNGNYPYGNAPKGEYKAKTTPVRTYPPNAWDFYDMHGNVWEWCADTYQNNYDGLPVDGSANVSLGGDLTQRVVRSGSWGSNSGFLRSANRNWDAQSVRNNYFGMRLVAVVK